MIKDTVREELQKERKKVNLILYNVRESSETNRDARVRHDINMVKSVNSASAEVKDIDKQIVSIHRLGKNNPDKARPLRVVFSKAKTKFDLLTNSFKLSTSENNEMRKVKLAIDRTQSEMNEHKRLIEEIERRKSHGESNLIIRKGRIVSKSDVQGNRPAAAGSINETGRIVRGTPSGLHLLQDGGAIGGLGLLEEEEVSDRMSEIRSVVSSENLEMDGALETEVYKFPISIRTNEFVRDDGGLGLAVGGFSASPRGDDQSIDRNRDLAYNLNTSNNNLKVGNQTCKILYTNADSLLNKKHELILRIQNIEPDIIAIVEALPKNVISCPLEAEFSLKGYSLITNFDVSKNLKLRGLVIYVKSKFNYEVWANPTNFREVLIVDIVLSLGNKLSIVLVYRSPSSSNEKL